MEQEKFLQNLFKEADVNQDGVLTKEEILAVVQKVSPGTTEAQVDAWIKQGDLDGDGKIDYNEFLQFYKSRST